MNPSKSKVEEICLASVWYAIGKHLVDSSILEKLDITDAYNEMVKTMVKNSGTQCDKDSVDVFKAKCNEITAVAEKYK